MYDAFDRLDVQVIAVAQEDKDLASHGKFHGAFKPAPRFEIVADLDRVDTKRYGRTTMYLIDKAGVVRQVFPNTVHHRVSWDAVLDETKRAMKE